MSSQSWTRAALEQDHVVAHALEVVQQVRRQDHRESAVRHGLAQRRQELAAGERVEGRHRLVEEQQAGPFGQRQPEAHLRPLAARERGDRSVQRHAQPSQALARPVGVPHGIEVGAERDVLVRAQAPVERHVLGQVSDAAQERLGPVGDGAEHADRAGGG